jgi:predicted PurR-regulated permease PerM
MMQQNENTPVSSRRTSTDVLPLPDRPRTPPPESAPIAAKAEWTVRRIILATLTVLGVGLAFYLLYRFYMVVFLLFSAIALQVALDPVVKWLRNRGMPRAVSVLLIYLLLLTLIFAGIWFAAPPLIEQGRTVFGDIPTYYQNLRLYLVESPIGLLRGAGAVLPPEFSLPVLLEISAAPEVVEATNGEEAAPAAQGWEWAQLVVRTLFALLAIFVLAFYWTLEGELIIRRLVMRAPAERREELRTLVAEFERKIGGYFRGTAFLSLVIGVFSTLAFFILGIPNALLLGLIMGIFEAVPIIGPTLGAIPSVLITLAVAPDKVFWVIGALVLIQSLEGNLLVPRVMDQTVGVNAVVSMLAVAAFGALLGIAGAILAIPMAAILQIILKRLLFNRPIGEEEDTTTPVVQAQEISRSRLGVLRLEAQELVQAMQNRAENGDQPAVTDINTEQVEDNLEALAAELDNVLAKLEGSV